MSIHSLWENNSILPQLFSTIVGGGIALVTVWITDCQKLKHDKKMARWQKESEKLDSLLEIAGKLAEILGSHLSLDYIEKEATGLLIELTLSSGKFKRRKGLLQAIRDFNNRAGIVLDVKRHHEDARDAISELESAYDALSNICDSILKE